MKLKRKVAFSLVIATMALSACGKKEESAPVVEENYTPVQTEAISLGSISRNLAYQGYVEANQTVNVTSKLSGIVENVYFDEGDYVEKGQVLFTIDKKDILDNISSLEASLKIGEQSVVSAQSGLNQASDGGQTKTSKLQLENSVKTAEINLENAKTSLETAEKSVENAKTSLETAKASFANTEKKYNDTKTLYEAGIVAKSDFDSIELAYTQAKNALSQAEVGVTQAENQKTQSEKSVANAQNTLTQAQDSLEIFNNNTTEDSKENAQNSVNTAIASKNATQTQLDIAKSNLSDTTVKAPISGYITKRNIEPSNMVSSQAEPFTIADVSTVTVNVNVSEKIINTINVGDSVGVAIDALENKDIVGKVKTVSPVADSTNTYPVKIEIENADGAIKAGMFAKVNFVEVKNDDAVVLPVDVVLETGGKKYVYSIDNENKAYKIEVETGLDNGTDVQITKGLKVGDTVIVSGQNYVEDGTLVKVVTDDASKEAETTANAENETKN